MHILNGPNGAEKTAKVFFTQGLENYLLLANKTFNIFRQALVKPEQYGIIRWITKRIDVKEYFKSKGIDIRKYNTTEELVNLLLSQDDLAEEFWKTNDVIKYGLTKELTFKDRKSVV